MKSTALLSEDHKQIVRVLNVLEEVTARVERGQEPDEKDVRDILTFLNGFGDRHHQEKEESLVFPALMQDRTQKNYRELCGLIFEHNRQRYLIEGIEDSMLAKKKSDFVFCASRLVSIVRTHMKEEEEILFPLMDSTLSPSDDERVVQQIREYDHLWHDKALSGLLRSLDNLESKYLSKAPNSAAMTA